MSGQPPEQPGEIVDSLTAALNLIALAEGGPFFLDRPERWLDDPHFRCENGHVSTTVLLTEDGDKCLGCSSPRSFVHLTFPEDKDGPLVAPTGHFSRDEDKP